MHPLGVLAFCSILLVPGPGRALDLAREYGHIKACQVDNPSDPANGAINDLWGSPTWVVPGEMAVSALVLHRGGHEREARLACDYLLRIQDADGSWCNRYSSTVATDSAKYARQTAQVMILLGRVGGYGAGLSKAARWLKAQQDVAVKGGNDDGLVGSGYDAAGNPLQDRWTSDNAWAVLAFEAAGETAARDRVVQGINTKLASGDHWVTSMDKLGATTDSAYGWISFAPAFAGLARFGVAYPAGLAEGIRTRLMEASGANGGAVRELADGPKYMPGIGFQASLAWNSLGRGDLTASHFTWAETVSGLYQSAADANGDSGGWIDWSLTVGGGTANWWERFIDTSAYCVMAAKGWSFSDPRVTAPPPPFAEEALAWPNPVTGDSFTLGLRLDDSTYRVTAGIYNAAFRRVWRGTWTGVSGPNHSVVVPGMLGAAPGLYLVRAEAVDEAGKKKAFKPVRVAIKRR